MTEEQELEERKVKALENIADSFDILTEWIEEIDKDVWGDRIEWYLAMWKAKYIDDGEELKSKKK